MQAYLPINAVHSSSHNIQHLLHYFQVSVPLPTFSATAGQISPPIADRQPNSGATHPLGTRHIHLPRSVDCGSKKRSRVFVCFGGVFAELGVWRWRKENDIERHDAAR